jgi:hypothetical protein
MAVDEEECSGSACSLKVAQSAADTSRTCGRSVTPARAAALICHQ